MRFFFAYIKHTALPCAAAAVCFLLLFGVYSLYGLPWPPTFYTALLIFVFLLGFWLLGLFSYTRKLRMLDTIKKGADGILSSFPLVSDALEQDYQELARTLDKLRTDTAETARRSAEEANRYYTLWSHQVKTPLSAMRLLLQEDAPDFAALRQELFKTEQYVDMALQYQRLGGDSNDLLLREFMTEVLVKQAVKKVSTLFIHKKVRLELASIPGTVLTDGKWFVFILEQLLTNAVKYTPAGGCVAIRAEQDALVIADTGIGIRPEDLPRVFEWGYTGCNGREEERHSTGLGLYLCQSACKLLGHRVMLSSTVGEGTQARLDFSRERLEVE